MALGHTSQQEEAGPEGFYDVFIDHRKVSDTLNMEFFFGYPSWLQDRTEDG